MNSVMQQDREPAAAGAPAVDYANVSEAALVRIMTAAVKAYAARCEAAMAAPPVVDRDRVTATEVVTVVSELIRAVDLNLFDVAMWYRRPQRSAFQNDFAGERHGG